MNISYISGRIPVRGHRLIVSDRGRHYSPKDRLRYATVYISTAMTRKRTELSQDMYHRIYRLGQRKIDPQRIAATLYVPVRSVRHVLDRFFENPKIASQSGSPKAKHEDRPKHKELLSVYVYTRTRYVVADIGGPVVANSVPALTEELRAVESPELRAVALRLTRASELDKQGAALLVDIGTGWSNQGRFTALLDPNPELEPQIARLGLDKKMPIFGTELAFEEAAFRGNKS